MDIKPYLPDAGFWLYYGQLLRGVWYRMLGVAVLIEAAIGVAYFIVLLSSEKAADAMWDYIVKHPLVVITPAFIAIGWLLLVAAHRQHATEVEKESTSARESKSLVKEAVDECDRMKKIHSDIDAWEKKDTNLKRSIERGNQIIAKSQKLRNARKSVDEVSEEVRIWVLKTFEVLKIDNPVWAKDFSADGHFNPHGMEWPAFVTVMEGYVRRLEEIRETWDKRHPTKLRD